MLSKVPAVDKLAEATVQPVSTTITSTKTEANRTKGNEGTCFSCVTLTLCTTNKTRLCI